MREPLHPPWPDEESGEHMTKPGDERGLSRGWLDPFVEGGYTKAPLAAGRSFRTAKTPPGKTRRPRHHASMNSATGLFPQGTVLNYLATVPWLPRWAGARINVGSPT